MMNVNELRDRVLELSHDEAAPDTGLQEKALRWLNNAYRELMDELQPFLQDDLMQEQGATTNTSGQAPLNQPVQRMLRVVDTTNGRVLRQVDPAVVFDDDPELSQTGVPSSYWINGAVVQIHPKSSVGLNMLYLPELVDLVADDTEDKILLPKAFHYALIWGGLVWSSVYERGFSSQRDLLLFQEKWDEARRRVKLSLSARPDRVTRVEAAEDFLK
jgi:hypothetical protein